MTEPSPIEKSIGLAYGHSSVALVIDRSQKHDLGKHCHHRIQLLIMAIFCATFQGMILSVLASEMQLLGHPKVFGPGGLTPFDQTHIYKPKMPIC